MHEHHTSLLGLILLLPLLGAAFNGLLGRKFLSNAIVHTVALATVGAGAVMAWLLAFQLGGMDEHHRVITQHIFEWVKVGGFQADFALWLDPVSAVMLLVITNVGFLIHLYSLGYMKGDPSYYRFFAYLNLFIFSMLSLVLGDNLMVLFLGWEGVGLCSYLLIGFWFEEKANARAGKKAFITNRVGDFGFALGAFLLFALFGTLDFNGGQGINDQLAHGIPAGMSPAMVNAAALLLFVGATGKSAQIPLYIWLPDAMAGPTPVSALIHAATMVTAGVYMIARLNVLFFWAPGTMEIVLWIGGLTALGAASIALVQNDIKKVLAYSTVSQLGFMFVAMGAGAWAVGMFHLMIHAFFKACLFLGSGSVIMAMHHEQDMRYYGGLKKFMPITYATFFAATLAISGVPLFAGFFSKDEILWYAFASERGNPIVWALVAAAALMTAFYMFRIMWMTFWGEHRGLPEGHGHGDDHDDHGHGGEPQESPWTVTVPLIALGLLSVFGGFLGVAALLGDPVGMPNFLHHWYHPVFQHAEVPLREAVAHNHALEWGLMGLSVAIAFASIGITWAIYGNGKDKLYDVFEAKAPGLHKLLWNKWFVDEIYAAGVINPLVNGSRSVLWRVVDVKIIDGAVNGVAAFFKGLARFAGHFQNGDTGNYATAMVIGLTLITASLLAIW